LFFFLDDASAIPEAILILECEAKAKHLIFLPF
jgi:hypothetical protein